MGYVVIGAGAFTFFGAITVIMAVPIIVPIIGVTLTTVWQCYIGFKLFGLVGSLHDHYDY
jgi:hypothetical protein